VNVGKITAGNIAPFNGHSHRLEAGHFEPASVPMLSLARSMVRRRVLGAGRKFFLMLGRQ
jgi:hypothetical protein